MKRIITGILVLLVCYGNSQTPTYDPYELYLTRIAAAEAFLQLNKISTAKRYLDACDKQYRDTEWFFLNAFLNQSERSLTPPGAPALTDVKINPAGNIAAVADADSLIHLYTFPELKLLKILNGHSQAVSTLAFSPDGRWLASGGRDHTVMLWEISEGKMIWENAVSFSQGIYQVRFSPDAATLGVVSWEMAEGSVAGFAKLLNLADGSEKKRIYTEPHPAAGIVFTENGEKIVVSCWGEMVLCFEVGSGEMVWKFDLSEVEGYNSFHSIDLSPDESTILLGSTDHRLYLLDSRTGELQHRIEPWEAHTKTVKAVSYTPDGKWYATAGEDQTIYIWDAAENTKKYTLIGHTKTVTGLCWAQDGSRLLSVSADGTLRLWNMEDPFARQYDICNYGPWQNPVSEDGAFFVAACSDKNLSIYSTKTGDLYQKLGDVSGLSADLSDDGQYAVTSSFDGVVRLWEIATARELKSFEGHTARVDGIAYKNSSREVLSVGDTTLRVWSVTESGSNQIIPFSAKRPFRIVLSPDEALAFVSFSDGTISAFNTENWREVAVFSTDANIRELTMSPDGKLLAAYCGNAIQIWDVAAGSLKYNLQGHEQSGYAIDFSPDGRYLISGSYDQTFKLWNLEKGLCTLTFHGYEETIYSAKFAGKHQILIGSSQGRMYFYDFSDSSGATE